MNTNTQTQPIQYLSPTIIPQVEDNSNTLNFRRYPNRKIYSVEARTYVNYRDILACIQAGHNVVIRDSRNGQDVTRHVLNELLFRVQSNELKNKSDSELQAMIRGLKA